MPDHLDQAPQTQPETPPSRLLLDYYGTVVFALLFLFVLGAVFILRPSILAIRETNAHIESQAGLADQEQSYLNSLNKSISAAQSISPTVLQQVGVALPPTADVPSLLLQFSAAAARQNIRIQSIGFTETKPTVAPTTAAPGNRPKPSIIQPVDINVTLNAKNYFEVKRFLADIEASLRLMDVTTITSAASGADIAYTLQLRAYTYPTSLSTSTKADSASNTIK